MRWPLVALALLVFVAPSVAAHNPALTVYEPVALEEGLVVVGAEGTVALVGLDGTTRWQDNTTDHVVQVPVLVDGHAVLLVQSVQDGRFAVQAFDADGPAWRHALESAAFGSALAAGPLGPAIFDQNGHVTQFSPTGETLATFRVAAAPAATPVAFADRWALSGAAGALVLVDGQGETVQRVQLAGRASAMLVSNDHLVVAVRGEGFQERTPVLALDERLDTIWARSVDGFLVATPPVQVGNVIATGTYNPRGAHVTAIDASGEVVWDLGLNETAAATGTDGERLFVVANKAVRALDPSTGEKLWSVAMTPRLATPVAAAGLVLVATANGTLEALDATTGEHRWSWHDGVDTVTWTDEELRRASGFDGPAPEPEAPTPAPWWAAVAALGLTALRRRP